MFCSFTPSQKNYKMSSSCEIENKPKGWSALLKTWYFWKPFAGFTAGAIAGALYFYFGAASGTSPVTSDLLSNTMFGGMIGFFILKRPCSSC